MVTRNVAKTDRGLLIVNMDNPDYSTVTLVPL